MPTNIENEQESKITVLVVEPDKIPYVKQIDPGLRSLQQAVDGYIEAVYPFDDPVAIIANEEAKLIGLPLNRSLCNSRGEIYDILAGTFLVTGLGEEDFGSLSKDLVEKYTKHFRSPEMFFRLDGRIISIPTLADEPELQKEEATAEAGEKKSSLNEKIQSAETRASEARSEAEIKEKEPGADR